MKRTNIVLDEKIVSEAKRLTGIETTRALVDLALRELVRRKSQLRLLDLRGKVPWEGNLAEMRRGRFGT
jgi:Arc/MetJ family transcription regulator